VRIPIKIADKQEHAITTNFPDYHSMNGIVRVIHRTSEKIFADQSISHGVSLAFNSPVPTLRPSVSCVEGHFFACGNYLNTTAHTSPPDPAARTPPRISPAVPSVALARAVAALGQGRRTKITPRLRLPVLPRKP
jgi:hypothetical protein